MSHDDMVAALVSYIQTDAGMLTLIRMSVTSQLQATNSDYDPRLTAIVTALGLYVTPTGA